MALASLCISNGHAETAPRPPDPALFQLGEVFVEETFSTAADLCSQRVPTSKDAWIEAARQWHEAHQEKLTALRHTSNSIAEALKSGAAQGSALDLGQFSMFSTQGPHLIMYGLATASDAKAYELCESLRSRYLDRKLVDQSLDQAQAAAAAALNAVSKH